MIHLYEGGKGSWFLSGGEEKELSDSLEHHSSCSGNAITFQEEDIEKDGFLRGREKERGG